MIKVAVTGATGFVGNYVLQELSQMAVDVIGVTRSINNSFKIKHPLIKFVEYDYLNPQSGIYEHLEKPDILIHLGWGGLPNYNSFHHFESELPAQFKFLSKLIEEGLSSLIVSGTCFEYGMQEGMLKEESLLLPNNPYSLAKYSLLSQLKFLQTKITYKLTWARFFYMYGEGQNPNSLYSQLKMAVHNGQKTFNMSGGEQLRDFLSIHEVARFISILSLNNEDYGAVNICSGQPISVKDIVEFWLKQNNWKISLNLGHYPYSNLEPMNFWGDPTKLKNILNSI